MPEIEQISQESHAAILELFPNPKPERKYRIVHTCPEFTSVCPKTGQPDFATITIDYIPNEVCLELKALKLYFYAYRQQGMFYEAVVNRILDDLIQACHPHEMVVVGDFNVRGGFGSVVTVTYHAAE